MKRLFAIILWIPFQSIVGQTDATKDSLIRIVSSSKDDTSKVIALITAGQYIEYGDLEEAKS
jgi:hypothetical protein